MPLFHWKYSYIPSNFVSGDQIFIVACVLSGPRFVVNTGEADPLGTVTIKPMTDTREIVFNVRAERDAQVCN